MRTSLNIWKSTDWYVMLTQENPIMEVVVPIYGIKITAIMANLAHEITIAGDFPQDDSKPSLASQVI